MTTRQQYDSLVATFESWLNWEGEADVGGLLSGLAEYYCEIRSLEEALAIPKDQRLDVRKLYGEMWRSNLVSEGE